MHEAYLDIYGVPTKVMTWGRWVEETPRTKDPEDIIICIPGNPGITKFYTDFLRKLNEQLCYPVWILSHAGHEQPDASDAPPLKDNEKLYSLEGQINHKKAFLDTYVPKNARIYFVGHSIGSYIILQLLKDPDIKERSQGVYLLFPTIEYMAQTKNGKIFNSIGRKLVWLIIFLCWVYTLLPSLLQRFIVQSYLVTCSVLRVHLDPIVNFIRPEVVDKVLFLALDELQTVKERDSKTLYENRDKIKLYYGSTDRWVPVEYYRRLKNEIPEVNAELCTRNIEHAFVLRHPQEVAALVANWIRG